MEQVFVWIRSSFVAFFIMVKHKHTTTLTHYTTHTPPKPQITALLDNLLA